MLNRGKKIESETELSEADLKQFADAGIPIGDVINLNRSLPVKFDFQFFQTIAREAAQALRDDGFGFSYFSVDVFKAIVCQQMLAVKGDRRSVGFVMVCLEVEKRFRRKHDIDHRAELSSDQAVALKQQIEKTFKEAAERKQKHNSSLFRNKGENTRPVIAQSSEELIRIDAVFRACRKLNIPFHGIEDLKKLAQDPRWQTDSAWSSVFQQQLQISRQEYNK